MKQGKKERAGTIVYAIEYQINLPTVRKAMCQNYSLKIQWRFSNKMISEYPIETNKFMSLVGNGICLLLANPIPFYPDKLCKSCLLFISELMRLLFIHYILGTQVWNGKKERKRERKGGRKEGREEQKKERMEGRKVLKQNERRRMEGKEGRKEQRNEGRRIENNNRFLYYWHRFFLDP